MSNKKSLSVKTVSILLVLVLLVGLAAGGTVAWLIDASGEVVNTFTYGDINIDLTEKDTLLDNDGNRNTNEYVMIPGKELEKDPIVTVFKDSEPNWLFVQLEKSGGTADYTFSDYLTYTVGVANIEENISWEVLDNHGLGENYEVYYVEFSEKLAENVKLHVLEGDKVLVDEDVTKEMVNALDEEGASLPKLTIIAYAIQREGFDNPALAWAEVKGMEADAAPVTTYVKTDAELQAALDNGVEDIALAADITGNVVVSQASGLKQTINGNGKTFSGVITVDGKSATYTTAGLTINDVNFKADSISADACIQLGDGTNATRYTCNVTVDNCTFDVPGAVGVKSYTGGDKNLTITNCTAAANGHSLVQAKGIDGILVEKCTVNSKNGLNFNNSDNVTVSNCTVDTKGYAVRFGESSGGTGAAETYLIKDCSLKSANDDGDAVIILRGTADYATLTIVNTTIEGTPDIINTATGATVVK